MHKKSNQIKSFGHIDTQVFLMSTTALSNQNLKSSSTVQQCSIVS